MSNRRRFVPAMRRRATSARVTQSAMLPGLIDRYRTGVSVHRVEVALTDDVLVVHGGTPLHGQIRVRGAKNLVSKAMVAALLGETPSRLYDVPRIRDVEVVRGLLELHGVRVTDGADDGELVFDPTNVETRQRRRDQRARRLEPHPDPALRPAAAPARPRVHPRPGRLPHRRRARSTSTSQALRQFGAVVDKTPGGPAPDRARTACTAPSSSCRTRASARPSRCCSPPSGPRASPSCATRRSSRRSST